MRRVSLLIRSISASVGGRSYLVRTASRAMSTGLLEEGRADDLQFGSSISACDTNGARSVAVKPAKG